MKIKAIVPSMYKAIRIVKIVTIISSLLLTVSWLTIAFDNDSMKNTALVTYLLFIFLLRYDYLISKKVEIKFSFSEIKIDGNQYDLNFNKVTYLHVHIRGYDREPNYSSFRALRSTGFNNYLSISTADQVLETKFYLKDPNAEKELVTFLQTHTIPATIKRFI